mgnify:CR=1 FL=1
MRMDKLTSKFQMALADAQSLALGRDHNYIEPVHVMVALLDQEGGTVRHLLTQADVNSNLLRSQLGEWLDRLPTVQGTAGEVHISNDLNRLLNLTDKLAQQRKDQYISSELFVLAALDDRGQLGELLRKAGAAKGPVEQAIEQMRGGQAVDDPNAEEQRQALADSIEQLEEPFLLVVVGEFNAGKSAFINALLGQEVLEEGVTPTAARIGLLRHGEGVAREVTRGATAPACRFA